MPVTSSDSSRSLASALALRPEPACSGQHVEDRVLAHDLPVVVIERRAFVKDCITRCLEQDCGLPVRSAVSAEEWIEQSNAIGASLILISRPGGRDDEELRELLGALARAQVRTPIVVLADLEDTESVVSALELGASGYIPTSLPLDVAVEAMRLVRAGGTFVPAASLLAAHRAAEAWQRDRRPSASMFTSRQMAVVEALRKGKANKLIAYELNMCESTVKVHVRNIMKKLKAKNRTQVAFMAGELLRQDRG